MASLAAILDAYETRGTRAVGAYCVNGHERAVWEQRYHRRGAAPARCCLLCQRERERQQRVRRAVERRAFAARPHPDELLWDAFCATIEQRIQAVRAETPRCSECGRAAS